MDTSTQSVKVVVCDLDSGEVIRTGRANHPAGTEVSAAAWLTAYRVATADPALLEGVEAISVGGQQHGMVTLDAEGELVRKALLWNDNRSAQDALELIDDLGGPDRWADAVGSVPVASFTVAKLRWLARHEPENAARVARVILPHDYLTWEIGGRSFEPVTDRGDASGTGYFDAVSNSYRDDLVVLAFDRTVDLPRVAAPAEIVGETPDGIAIGPGTGDNAASALGMVVPDRTALISLGTSGVACLPSSVQTHDASGVIAGFADATGRFLPLVCTLNGARNLVAMASTLQVSLAELSELAMSAPAGSEGLVFLPYLEGERTPPLPDATGELRGMTLTNLTAANLARATIEGVLWSLAYGVQTLREQASPVEQVMLTGGAAQSPAVRSIAADVFGVPVLTTDPYESVAVGAARQAAWALTGSLPEWPSPVSGRLEAPGPESAIAQELDARYRAALGEVQRRM